MASDVSEMTVEQRVKKVMAFAPSLEVSDAEVIALTVALAHGGTRVSQRIEQIAVDMDGLAEQRAWVRQQYEALREELQAELASLAAAVAEL